MFQKLLVTHYLIVISCLLASGFVNGQQPNPVPCTDAQQITIATDAMKEKILSDFIKKSIQEKYFSALYDKGIIHLYQYHNSNNNLCWRLYAHLDDEYKDNPPTRFSDFNGDIILIYEADSTGRPQQTQGDKKALIACLEQIIGDRVFIRPSARTRWTNGVFPFARRTSHEGARRLYTGGGGGIYVEFHKDNTYTISPMM